MEGYWTEQAAGGAYTVAQLVGRGLRYVLPDWREEQQLGNGATKVLYTGGKGRQDERRADLERRFSAWFEAAGSAEEIAGRLIVALAAAHYALDECVPRSQRACCSIYPGKDERGLRALERITRKAIPASPGERAAEDRVGRTLRRHRTYVPTRRVPTVTPPEAAPPSIVARTGLRHGVQTLAPEDGR